GRQGTLWASAWGYGSGSDQRGVTTYRIGTDLDAAHEHYERETDGEYGFATRDVGIGFKQVFQPQRHELTVDLRQSLYANAARSGRQGTLWASAWGYGSGSDQRGVTTYRIGTDLDAAHEHYERETDGEYGFATRDVGIGFKQVFQPQRHELTVDLRQSLYANDA